MVIRLLRYVLNVMLLARHALILTEPNALHVLIIVNTFILIQENVYLNAKPVILREVQNFNAPLAVLHAKNV